MISGGWPGSGQAAMAVAWFLVSPSRKVRCLTSLPLARSHTTTPSLVAAYTFWPSRLSALMLLPLAYCCQPGARPAAWVAVAAGRGAAVVAGAAAVATAVGRAAVAVGAVVAGMLVGAAVAAAVAAGLLGPHAASSSVSPTRKWTASMGERG